MPPLQPTYRYWAGPWDWRENAYQAPGGAFTLVDLRPVALQSVANHGAGVGSGLFVTPADVMLASEWTLLGEGFVTAIHTDNAMRSAWQSVFGVNPQGDFLVDYLAYTLTDGADPNGLDAPKPVDVQDGPPAEALVTLAGHSPVWRRSPDVKNGNGRWVNSLRKVYRVDLERIANTHHPDVWRKVLGARKIKMGQRWDDPDEEAWITNALKERGPAKDRQCYAMRPTTAFAETWPNATSDIEATAQDQTWETISNGTWVQTIAVVGNRARSSAGDDQRHFGRCLSAVSSANHIASALVYQSASYDVGVCSRMASGGVRDAYDSSYRFGALLRLIKWVDGAPTTLGSSAMSGSTSGATCTMRSNGSTQTATLTGASNVAVTDTAITGNLCGGIVLNVTTGQTAACEVGAWSIDDEIVAGQPHAKRFGGVPYAHSLGRGVW